MKKIGFGKISATLFLFLFARASLAWSEPFPAVMELSSLDGSNGFAINGIAAYDGAGVSASDAGDINGDGIGDVIIGAGGADPNGTASGQSYVVFGTDQGFPAALELSSLDGSNGFGINGIEAYDFSGRSVSGAGDVNGDGFDDVVIGAVGVNIDGNREVGQGYVIFGSDRDLSATIELSALDGQNGFTLNGIAAYDGVGVNVSDAGDVNGDGIDDLIIWAIVAQSGYQAGQIYVIFGTDQGFRAVTELAELDGRNGFTLQGIAAFDQAGRGISSAGDVNGDGIDDLVIGAPGAPNGSMAGQAYVVFGSNRGFPAALDLSSLDGRNGFALNGLACHGRPESAAFVAA